MRDQKQWNKDRGFPPVALAKQMLIQLLQMRLSRKNKLLIEKCLFNENERENKFYSIPDASRIHFYF